MATPTCRPCSRGRAEVASRACEIRCSLPLAGRDEPQISIAIPLSMSAVASSRMPSRSSAGWLRNEWIDPSDNSAAKSSTGSPVAWNASFQSRTAVNLATRSPTPESVSIRGASRQTAGVDDDPERQRGRQRPPLAADRQARLRAAEPVVRQRGRHRVVRQPAEEPDVLRHVERLAAADADDGGSPFGRSANSRAGGLQVVVRHLDPRRRLDRLLLQAAATASGSGATSPG